MHVTRRKKRRKVGCLAVAMGRPRKISKGKTVLLSVRIPDDLAVDLDHETEVENSARAEGPKAYDRSDVVRMALRHWVQGRKQARGE